MSDRIKNFFRKEYTFKLQVGWMKILCWFLWTWLLTGLFISAVGFNVASSPVSFKKDYGVLVLITILISLIAPCFIREKKNESLIVGVLLFLFSFFCFIGTIITNPTVITFAIWTIPLLGLSALGVVWFLIGLGVVRFGQKHNTVIPKTMPPKTTDTQGETFRF